MPENEFHFKSTGHIRQGYQGEYVYFRGGIVPVSVITDAHKTRDFFEIYELIKHRQAMPDEITLVKVPPPSSNIGAVEANNITIAISNQGDFGYSLCKYCTKSPCYAPFLRTKCPKLSDDVDVAFYTIKPGQFVEKRNNNG